MADSRGSGQMTTHNSDQLLDMLRQEVISQGSDRPGHRDKGAVQDSLSTYRSVDIDSSSDDDREERYTAESPAQNHQRSRDSPHLPYQPKGYSHDRNVSSESDRYSISTTQQTTRPRRTGPGSVQQMVRQLDNSDNEDDDEDVRDSLEEEEDDLAEEENYQQQLKERLKQEQEQLQSDDSLEDGEGSPSDSLDIPVQRGGGNSSEHSPSTTRGSDRYEDLERGSQTPGKDPYANLRYDPNWKDRGALIVSTPYVQEELKARTRMVDFEQDFFPADSLESADKNTLRLGTPHPTRDSDNSREESRESEDSRYTIQTESGTRSVSRGSSDDRTPVRDHRGGKQSYSSPEEEDPSEREEIRGYQRALKVGEPRVVPYNKPFPSPPQAPYPQQPSPNAYHWPPVGGEEEESGYHSKKDSEQVKQKHRPVGPVGYTSPRAVGPVVQKAPTPEDFKQSSSPNDEYYTSPDITVTNVMTNQRPAVEKPPLPRPPKTEKPPPKSFIERNKENLNRQEEKKGGSYARRYAQKKALHEQPPSPRRKKEGKKEVSEPNQEDVEDFSNMTAEEVWQLKQERLRQAKEAKSGAKSGKKSKPQKNARTDASPPSKASSASSTASKNSQESMELRSISQTTTQVDAPSIRMQGAPQYSPQGAGYQSQALPPQLNQSQQGLYPEGFQTSPHAYQPMQQPMYAFPSPQAPINVNINLSIDEHSPKQGQGGNRVSPRVTVDTQGRQEEYQDFPDTKHHSPGRHRQDDSPLRHKQREGRHNQELAYNSTHGPPEEMGGYGPRSPESHRSHPQTRPRQIRKETAYTTLSDPTDKATRPYRRERTFSKPPEHEEGYDYQPEPVQGSYAQIHQAERRLVQEEQQQRQRSLPGSGVREPHQGAYTEHQERPDHMEHWAQRGGQYDDPFNSSQEYEEGPPHTYAELHGARRAQEAAQHHESPRGPHSKGQQHPGVQHGPHYRAQGPPQHRGPSDRPHHPPQHHGPHYEPQGPNEHHGPNDRPHGPSQHHGPHVRTMQGHQAPDHGPQQHGHPAWHADPNQPPHPHFPPYLRNVGRRSSEGDIVDFYQQEGVRRESFSPYSKIPPIGPQEEKKTAKNTINHANKQTLKTKSNSEGYLASYAKSKAMAKKKPATYKAYTVQDYKNLKKDIRLGGLGPDLERVQDKVDKIRRQKEYANSLREQHAKQKTDWQKKRDGQPHYPQEEEDDFYSRREVQEVEEEDDAQKRRKRALQYAKSVPKPKPAPPLKTVTVLETQHPDTIPYHHPPPTENHQPNVLKIERGDPVQPSPNPALSEIQKMRMRHEKDRANAEAIRRNMGSKAQGVVDS
ncbi:Hypp2724 [Branchiostoma lanceolatum]|uniref:Hypp2724 protein n=1 Tax=Branchiostoma lanceolatum TaxID=7740 RepID=A0A8J9ZTX4_BRALA|nr:Hypp2724 [Branchiostoma lanceolatum]